MLYSSMDCLRVDIGMRTEDLIDLTNEIYMGNICIYFYNSVVVPWIFIDIPSAGRVCGVPGG